MAIDGVVTIPMLGRGVSSVASTDTTFERSLTPLNTNDYDGSPTYYFKIDAINVNVSNAYNVYLVDSGGTTKATISVPASTGSSGNYTALWSSSFTPVTGDEDYRVKLEGTGSGDDVQLSNAEIQVELSGATKAAICINLGFDDDVAPSQADATQYLWNTQTGTYLADNSNTMGAWEYVAGQYAGSAVSYYFEVTALYSDASPNYGNCGLLDIDNANALVSSSELQVEGGSVIRIVRQAITVGDLTDGHLYEWNAHSNGFLKNMSVFSARIWIKVTDISSIRFWHALQGGEPIGASGDFDRENHRHKWESSKYTDPTTGYAHVTRYAAGSTGCSTELQHYGTNDGPGTTGLTSVTTDNLSSSKGYQEKAVSLTNNNRYGAGANRSANSGVIYQQWLVVDVEDTGNKAVSDDMDNWGDSVATSFHNQSFVASEDLDNWADWAQVQRDSLEVDVSDDIYNWGEALSADWNLDADAVSDDMNNWGHQEFDLDLSSRIELYGIDSVTPAAEDMDNWNDAVATDAYAQQSKTASDDLDNWNDSVSIALNVQQSISVSDDINSGKPWADAVETSSARRFGDNIGVLVQMNLPTGTKYVSSVGVEHPTQYYEGSVTAWGTLERSIPVPAGLPRISDFSYTLDDTAQEYRTLFAQVNPKGSTVISTLVVLGEGGSLGGGQRIYIGRIENVRFPEGEVVIEVADITFEFLKKDMPPLGNITNFENYPTNDDGTPYPEVFIPFVFGDVDGGEGGALQIPLVDTTNHRYAAARHVCEGVTGVYVRTPGSSPDVTPDYRTPDRLVTRAPDDDFVENTSYSVVTEEMTIEDITYTMTFVQFPSALADGAEVRINISGMPKNGFADDGASRNAAVVIKQFLQDFALQVPSSDIDGIQFAAVEATCDDLDLHCDGVLNSQMNYGSGLSRIVSSFNIDLFQNIGGQISLALSLLEDPNRPLMDDLQKLLLKSVNQSLPDPIYNKFNYKYEHNFATGDWVSDGIYNNDIDQAASGEEIETDVELWFVRETATAEIVISSIATYFSLESYTIEFETPAPETVDQLELAKSIGVTHYGGISETGTGYDNTEFKVVGLRFTPTDMKYKVDAIKRIEPVLPGGGQLTEVMWKTAAWAGPYRAGSSQFFGVFNKSSNQKKMRIAYSLDWGRNWDYDDSSFTLTNNVGSYDSFERNFRLHIVTQEDSTGRVAYHKYNMLSRTWEIEDEEVVSATNLPGINTYYPAASYGGGNHGPCTDIVVRSTGEVCIFYQDSDDTYDDLSYLLKEGAAGYYAYGRIRMVRRLSAGNYSSPFNVGIYSTDRAADVAFHGVTAYLKRSNDVIYVTNRAWPGAPVAYTPDFFLYAIGSGAGFQGDCFFRTSLPHHPGNPLANEMAMSYNAAIDDYILHVPLRYEIATAQVFEFEEKKIWAGDYHVPDDDLWHGAPPDPSMGIAPGEGCYVEEGTGMPSIACQELGDEVYAVHCPRVTPSHAQITALANGNLNGSVSFSAGDLYFQVWTNFQFKMYIHAGKRTIAAFSSVVTPYNPIFQTWTSSEIPVTVTSDEFWDDYTG